MANVSDPYSIIDGVYTSLEECNMAGWMDDSKCSSACDTILNLLQSVRNQTGKASPQVWASPYYVGNFTLHPTANLMPTQTSGQNLESSTILRLDCSSDSMGWQGNSFGEVKEVLIDLQKVLGRNAHKQVWSNVELFEGGRCLYPKKCGRHPALSNG